MMQLQKSFIHAPNYAGGSVQYVQMCMHNARAFSANTKDFHEHLNYTFVVRISCN